MLTLIAMIVMAMGIIFGGLVLNLPIVLHVPMNLMATITMRCSDQYIIVDNVLLLIPIIIVLKTKNSLIIGFI